MSGWPEKSGLSTDSDGRMASPSGGVEFALSTKGELGLTVDVKAL
jgi:hypothetical protein